MLLRRVIEHVKTQNWTAVALDFLIVVVGILIAFQITEWSEARNDLAKEKVYLARLDSEMDVILDRLQTGLEIAKESSEGAEYLISLAASETALVLDNQDREKVRRALRNLRAGRVPAGSPAAFRQMVSNGELTLLRNEELRDALFAYDEFAAISREVWRGGWEEFLTGYRSVVPVIDAQADFAAPLSETYHITGFDAERLYTDENVEEGLKVILGAKVNHYEVLNIQLSLALDIDRLIAEELAK
jgi:hypothetical protein